NTVITAGMRAIVVAEDSESFTITDNAPPLDEALLCAPKPRQRDPERLLILGWNHRGKVIVSELSRFVAPGSRLTIAADTPDFEDDVRALNTTENLSVDHRVLDISHHVALESLDVADYDHVIVLACSDALPAQQADTRTLVCLLHLRHITERASRHV